MALIQTAVYLNAALTAFDLQRELATLGNANLRVVYGVYDLVSQRVRSLPARTQGQADTPVFGDAPRTAEHLSELTARLVESLTA